MQVISIKNLTKKFGKITAVDNLNLEVNGGEIFALLGPNGAGKTTTIFILCGLLPPTIGKAFIADYDVEKYPLKVRSSIGVVFQQPSVDDLLTGRENLEMHALLYSVPEKIRNAEIDRVLRLLDLEERQHSLVREYSGGMRKRLEIARALLHRPKILILDEPTVGLDIYTRNHIWEYIKKISKSEQTTILFTTHYLEEAEQYADRVGIIDSGKLILVGKPKSLIQNLHGDILKIQVKDPKIAIKAIQKLNFLKILSVKQNEISLSIKEPSKNLPVFLSKYKGVISMELQKATLNEVFLKFTQKNIEEAEGSFWERIMSYKK